MRNVLTKASGTAIAIAAAALLSSGSAYASHLGGAEHATVINEFEPGCGLGTDASGLSEDLFTTDIIAVITPSGNSQLSCFFDIPFGVEPARPMVNDGFNCVVFVSGGVGITTDSRSIATPGGRAILTCKINGN